MGARLYAYGVDLPRLSKFLDNSLAELLCRFVQDRDDPREMLSLNPFVLHTSFWVAEDGFVRGPKGDDPSSGIRTYTPDQLKHVPALQLPARHYISEDGPSYLLRRFSHCRGIGFIRRLIDGDRRWWIGSLLQAAAVVYDADRCGQLVHLFHKILRGWNCGFAMPNGDCAIDATGLPWTPRDDPDMPMGRWNQDDVATAYSLLPDLVSATAEFGRPPLLGAGSYEDTYWHAWVTRNIAAVTGQWLWDFDEPNLITFHSS